MMRSPIVVVALAAWIVPSPVLGGPVTGTVRTVTREGAAAAAAIVYAEPLDGPAPRRPQSFTLTQKDKTFRPQILAVPAGSTVEFPNEDSIFHNVFSLSWPQPRNRFAPTSGCMPGTTVGGSPRRWRTRAGLRRAHPR